ncbi:hypothetical protein [Paenibacillus sp. sgz302251]|uniref:hypothetical protein n=1 Tax=Paenibacillus sp. sgz302251 TaxID=3414493 RepID=UPI003C7DFFF4
MKYTAALSRAKAVADASLHFNGLQIPHVSQGNSYKKGFHPKIMWMAGFWPGLLWLLYQYTGDQKYADKARG